jgi:hypothetical protein
MGELFELIKEVFGVMGVPYNLAKDFKGMLQEEGLEKVEGWLFDVPLGAKNPDAELGRKSAWAFLKGAEGLVGAAMGKFHCSLDALSQHTRVGMPNCSFTPEKVDALARHVKQELD